MNLEQFKYLISIAQTHSMHTSAEQLFVSQQNISKQLKKLESELGIKLFNYAAGKTTLTEEGQNVYRSAIVIINEVNKLKADYSAINHCLDGTITIYTSFSNTGYYNSFSKSFYNKFQNISQIWIEKPESELLHSMKNLQGINLCIMQSPTLIKSFPGYNCHYLGQTRLHVLLSKKNIYAKNKTISLEELSSLPIMTRHNADNKNYSIYMEALKNSGITITPIFSSNSENMIHASITADSGAALIANPNVENFYKDGVVAIPIEKEIFIYNYFFAAKHLSPCEKVFYEFFGGIL